MGKCKIGLSGGSVGDAQCLEEPEADPENAEEEEP